MTNTTLRMIATLLMVAGFAVLTDALALPSNGESPAAAQQGSPADVASPLSGNSAAAAENPRIDEAAAPPPSGLTAAPSPLPTETWVFDEWCETDDCLDDKLEEEGWCEIEGTCPQ